MYYEIQSAVWITSECTKFYKVGLNFEFFLNFTIHYLIIYYKQTINSIFKIYELSLFVIKYIKTLQANQVYIFWLYLLSKTVKLYIYFVFRHLIYSVSEYPLFGYCFDKPTQFSRKLNWKAINILNVSMIILVLNVKLNLLQCYNLQIK